MKKIVKVINTVKEALQSSDNRQLMERLKTLKGIKNEFSKKYKEYRKAIRDYSCGIAQIRGEIKELVQDLEIVATKKNVMSNNIPLRVPKDLDRLKAFMERLICVLQSLRLSNYRMYVETLRNYCAEIDSLEKENHKVKRLTQEYNDICRRVEREIGALEQILHPEENVLVNVRERFD